MAGYLGKISAVISANTGDFTAKLNQSAKEVGRFAKSMESTLGAASRQAASSLANIYTPLQKVERALQAASTQKLQFAGFAGAIKTVEALRDRLASLGDMKQRQVDVILKTTGLKDINAFRDAIYGLKSKEFDLLVRVGGADKVKELRAQIAAGAGEFAVVAETRRAEASIKSLTEQLSAARAIGKQIVVTIDDTEIAAAKKSLADLVATQSQALGKRRNSPTKLGDDLTAKRALEEVALADLVQQQGSRDAALGRPGVTPKQEERIRSNYGADLDAKVEKQTAAVRRLTEAQDALAAARKRVVDAEKGVTTKSNPEAERLSAELEEAKRKHEEFRAEAQKKISLAVGFDVPLEDIDALLDETINKGDVLERIFQEAGTGGAAALQKVADVLRNLGISDLEANVEKMRQMQDVTEQLTKPLGEVQKAIASLDLDSQGSLLKTLTEAQSRTESLVDTIKQTDTPAAQLAARFQEALGWINKAADAANRVKEASALVGGLATGRELRFQSPAVAGALAGSAAVGQAASALPASAIQANPQIAKSLISVRSLSEDVVKKLAELEDLGARGLDFDGSAAQRELADLIEKLREAQRVAGQQINVSLGGDASGAAALLTRRAQAEQEFYAESQRLQQQAASDAASPLIRRAQSEREFAEESARLRRAAAEDADIGSSSSIEERRRTLARQARQTRGTQFRDRFGGQNAQELDSNIQGQSLSGYEAQLRVLMRTLGRVSTEARGPATESFMRLQAAIDTAFQNGTLDAEATRNAIRGLTTDAVRATSAVTGVSRRRLGREVSRAGDVGRGGFDNFSLALNQAAFAIDDFMSSTGGLEFKLRAVSNNVTQLAFIMGGTTGLFIGLGAVIGGQLAVSLIKWANNGKTAEDQTKALNDSLARQKSMVEELAQAYQSLGREISRGTQSRDTESASSILSQRREAMRTRDNFGVEAVRSNDARSGPIGFSGRIGRFFEPFLLSREEQFARGGLVGERALQNSQIKRRDESDDPGERAAAETELRMSRRRERDRANFLARQPLPNVGDVSERMQQFAAETFPRGGVSDIFAPGAAFLRRGAAIDVNEISQNIPAGTSIKALAGQVESLRGASEAAVPTARERGMFGLFETTDAQRAKEFQAQNKQDADRIQQEIDRRLSAGGDAVYAAMEEAAAGIRFAQDDVASAIEKGVVAAAPLQELLNSLASELSSAQSDLERALTASPDELGVSPVQREQMINQARGRVESIRDRQSVAEAGARAATLGRQYGGARSQGALSGLEGNQRFASQSVEGTASLRAAMNEEAAAARAAARARSQQAAIEVELEKSRTALRQQRSATTRDVAKESQLEGEVKAGEAALELARKNTNAATAASTLAAKLSDAQAAAAEFSLSLERSLARTRKVGESAVGERERFADDMANRYIEGRGVTPQQRDQAELDVIQSRTRIEAAQAELDRVRDDMRRSPEMQDIESERARIESQMRDDAAAASTSVGVLSPEASGQAMLENRQRLIELQGQADEMMYSATSEQRQRLDAERYQADQQQRAFRGRDLGLTERDRAVKEFGQGTGSDVAARANELRRQGQDPKQYVNEAFREQRREIAPALKALEDERQSALLMGPNRQPLQFSDTTTQQGQAELTRLLRGQDSAQERNLAELNKQSGILEDIRRNLERQSNVTIDM
jgi:hypothetical protein